MGGESGFRGVRDGHCGGEGAACGAPCAAQEGELGGGFERAEGVDERGQGRCGVGGEEGGDGGGGGGGETGEECGGGRGRRGCRCRFLSGRRGGGRRWGREDVGPVCWGWLVRSLRRLREAEGGERRRREEGRGWNLIGIEDVDSGLCARASAFPFLRFRVLGPHVEVEDVVVWSRGFADYGESFGLIETCCCSVYLQGGSGSRVWTCEVEEVRVLMEVVKHISASIFHLCRSKNGDGPLRQPRRQFRAAPCIFEGSDARSD